MRWPKLRGYSIIPKTIKMMNPIFQTMVNTIFHLEQIYPKYRTSLTPKPLSKIEEKEGKEKQRRIQE
jgi:hypothetical protein